MLNKGVTQRTENKPITGQSWPGSQPVHPLFFINALLGHIHTTININRLTGNIACLW